MRLRNGSWHSSRFCWMTQRRPTWIGKEPDRRPDAGYRHGLAIYHKPTRRVCWKCCAPTTDDLAWGDEEFDQLASAYICQCPSVHYSLRWLGKGFASFVCEYLVPEQGAPLAELAALEWAFTLAFDAPAGSPLTLEAMASLAPEDWPGLQFKPTPSLQRLECKFNSLSLWRSVKEEIEFPASMALAAPQVCLIWRNDLICHYRSLEAAEARPERAAQRRLSFAELCAALAVIYVGRCTSSRHLAETVGAGWPVGASGTVDSANQIDSLLFFKVVYPQIRRLKQGGFSMLAQLPPALQNLQLPLRLRLWDGHEFNLGPTPSVTIVVKDPQMVTQFTHPSLDALGAAFVEGKLELEGSISEVILSGDELSNALLGADDDSHPVRSVHDKETDAKAISYHTTVQCVHQLWLDSDMRILRIFRNWQRNTGTGATSQIPSSVPQAALQPGDYLLDVGCGWGGLARYAAREFGAKVFGITLSKEQLELARERVKQEGLQDRSNCNCWTTVICPGRSLRQSGQCRHVRARRSRQLAEYCKTLFGAVKEGGLVMNHGITAKHTMAVR